MGELDGPEEWPLQQVDDRAWTEDEILFQNEEERPAFLRTIRPTEFDDVLLEKSLADVRDGKILGPFFSPAEAQRALGVQRVAISRRFGRRQGKKVRECDDLKRGHVNKGVKAKRKLRLSTIDSYARTWRYTKRRIAKRRGDRPGSKVKLWKYDLKGAYRQLALRRRDQKLGVVVFNHPSQNRPVFFCHLAVMFGGAGSVISFNRVSRALTFLGRKMLRTPVDSYCDDFFGCEVETTAESGFRCFGQLAAIVGTVTAPDKELPPASEGPPLGSELAVADDPMEVSIKESRRENIDNVMSDA